MSSIALQISFLILGFFLRIHLLVIISSASSTLVDGLTGLQLEISIVDFLVRSAFS
jgi:hypothetical protein